MRYGDLQFTNEVIGDFEGDLDIEPGHSFAKLFKKR